MAFLGMRGTGDFVANERPQNWRQQILRLYPNGDAPLTAILSMMASEPTDDPTFNWWTQSHGHVNGAITNIYTDPTMSTAYVSGGAAGDTLYVKVAAALANQMRKAHQVLLQYTGDPLLNVNAKVLAVAVAGANSMITVMLLEADDNSASYYLADADHLMVIGTINPEGGTIPTAVAKNPSQVFNHTQIFWNPLDLTRTALKTRLRTEPAYQRAKMECLEQHSIEMELALIWGIYTSRTGENGKPERTTMGLVQFINTYGSANVANYTTDTDFTSTTWASGGKTWLDNYLMTLFKYGAPEKLAFCGNAALLGIQNMVEANTTYNISKGEGAYGINVRELLTPFGTLMLKTHPLFSHDVTTQNMMLILEPKELKFRYIDDTMFYGESDSKTHPKGYGATMIDGKVESYLTEAGLEFGQAEKCGILYGVGKDNELEAAE